MEKKYNSLKEALPSLLEEKTRLEEEVSRIEIDESNLDEEKAALDNENICLARKFMKLERKIKEADKKFNEVLDEIDDLDKDEINLGRLISKYERDKEKQRIRQEATEMQKELGLLVQESNRLKKLGRKLFFKFLELTSEKLVLLGDISKLSLLIQITQDISLIADVDFKIRFKNHQYLFDPAFNDMLDTNSLAWIYKFSKNNNASLSKENMSKLVTNVIETNIPAYMYLVAVKINNIPDEDMKCLIAEIVASNDKKYIDYLLLTLPNKGLSREVKEFISILGISISPNNFIDYNNTFADELEKALLEDDYETLYKHGMYSHDDRALVLANIQAGL